MSNIIDYVNYNQTPLEDDEFNEIDGLVLAELAYIHWDEILVLSDAELAKDGFTREQIKELLESGGNNGLSLNAAIALIKKTDYYKNDLDDKKVTLLTEIERSNRFSIILLGNFEAESKQASNGETGTVDNIEQFAAMTFIFRNKDNDDPQVYVSFRGTDGTLEGWNEDFLMAYESETAAQRKSVEYLNRVAPLVDGDIRMGGHSKGGNHSNYAFLFCDEEIRSRIVKLYSYDGPGFNFNLTYMGESVNPKNWQLMIKLLEGTAVAPYDSIIGLLLVEHGFIFINTDAGLLLDHDPYTWMIDPDSNCFIEREQSDLSKYLNELLDECIQYLPDEQKRTFIDTIWDWIYSLNVNTLDEVGENFQQHMLKTIFSFIAHISNLSDEDKADFMKALGSILLLTADNFLEDKLPGYEKVKMKLEEVLENRNLTDWQSLLDYLMENPVENTLELISEFLLDFEVLKALTEMSAAIVTVSLIATALAAVIATLTSLIQPYIPLLTALVVIASVLKLAFEFIYENWDKIISALETAKEYITEKIAEFAEALKLAIASEINTFIASVLYVTNEIVEGIQGLTNTIKDVCVQMKNLMSHTIQITLKLTNPLLYGIIRTVCGLMQSSVTVDMTRLQNAVDQMERLASRVQNIDSRLSSLYRTLAISNIEMEEGVFTSIINLYNLSSADINVDDGYAIRRKATAIKDTFCEYTDVEKWVQSQLRG